MLLCEAWRETVAELLLPDTSATDAGRVLGAETLRRGARPDEDEEVPPLVEVGCS